MPIDAQDDQPKRIGRPPLRTTHSVASLRLNVEEAMNGRTWLLLPEGFRDKQNGMTYPLPSSGAELQKLIVIPIPPNTKVDCGCVYLRRAVKKWTKRQARRNSAIIGIERREHIVATAEHRFKQRIRKLKTDVESAVDDVRKEAEQAIASLNDLFALGRKGVEAQMRAHLDGNEWQGERISASAFRECFRMVTQAVKGLGLPSEQRGRATEAIMEELAASMKDTQETVALAPGTEAETEH